MILFPLPGRSSLRPRRLAAALSGAVLILIAAIGPDPARAHPHAWIDLRSTVLTDEDGRVTGLRLYWLFDPLYSAYTLDDTDADGAARQAALDSLARRNLANLEPYGYFTEIRRDETRLPLSLVETFETGMADERLWLRFELRLETPVDPRAHAVDFAVYDPSYYIEILHLADDVIAFEGPAATGCTARIVPPSPSTDALLLAQQLDIDAEPEQSLGAQFAERVTLACPTS